LYSYSKKGRQAFNLLCVQAETPEGVDMEKCMKRVRPILKFISREWSLVSHPLRKPAKPRFKPTETSIKHEDGLLEVLTESLPPALGRALGEGAEVECRHLLGRYKVEKAKYGKVSLLPSAW
jgi:hypothetical protein